MGKQTELVTTLNEMVEESLYKPTKREKEAKAAYWVAIGDDPFFSKEQARKREVAERLAGTRLMAWEKPGFQEWFFNKTEFKIRLEYLFGLCLEAAEEILLNNDPKVQGARVQLIRALSELAGKVPHKQATIQVTNNTAISGAIDTMSREDLERYLAASNSTILLDSGEKS